MIAEVLLVLAGHDSSLFPIDHTVNPAFAPLLHPGEQQCLEALGLIALRYKKIRDACSVLARSQSRYICALCATLKQILRDEYEELVIDTEAKVLKRDASLVARGCFVPLSSIRATFAEWDAPFAALLSLLKDLESRAQWPPGVLIDMLMTRSQTGVHRISEILSRLCTAVQAVWRTQVVAFLVHGSLSPTEPLASANYILVEGALPSCVSTQSRDSIVYVGRAIGTVKSEKWQKQLPRSLALEHTKMLETVLPEDRHTFDRVVAEIRTNLSEWLWVNVLTRRDVEEAVDSLASYFLLRNGEFGLSLIREIERLKVSRLTARSGPSTMIREQDLHLALLRASLGTTAEHDPSLSRLRFQLPSGPLRPLLPSLANIASRNVSTTMPDYTTFDDLILGTPLILTYAVAWPLDLFLQPSDLQIYAALFAYVASIRKTHTRIHGCWSSLSNAQRARRRWTGLSEGGTSEDLEVRKELLRCGWGVVREMNWFLDTLLGYVMTDVIDLEFRRLKTLLHKSAEGGNPGRATPVPRDDHAVGKEGTSQTGAPLSSSQNSAGGAPSLPSHLDFTTLRNIHSTYLERLSIGTLLANQELTAILRPILEVCERFVAQVERWGGDVLPALLFEGSLAAGGHDKVGAMVEERKGVVAEINTTLQSLLESFYEQLSLSTSRQPFTATADASKSMLFHANGLNVSGLHATFMRSRGAKGLENDGEARRHVERLLLRLDFNGGFSKTGIGRGVMDADDILKQGGLV
ncbi:hypothetical protein JAAARDRAFT_371232 [Jaapia argillacea MUCL 33604]|uniref:Spindle pole body component n=1 Tax=Jaapia argillacea MUCL 33604 TaxID=933084 RepID=A0A067Q8A9_9AGAM|nr:hypothetical protein JAAARDRAFT_371232 [Jaapia argillacea MUCL 33604]